MQIVPNAKLSKCFFLIDNFSKFGAISIRVKFFDQIYRKNQADGLLRSSVQINGESAIIFRRRIKREQRDQQSKLNRWDGQSDISTGKQIVPATIFGLAK